MAVRIAPVVRQQFCDDDGNPAVGGTLETYAAGSTTPLPTYTDSTGGVANATAITLNARGETPAGVWLTEGRAYKFVLKDADGVTLWSEDGIRGVNDASLTIDEWVSSGQSPTYISGTSFSLPGDQTSEFHVGRRLKTSISAGTGYHAITASSYSAGTTTITVNGTTLDSGLSAVSYGILRGTTNHSLPVIVPTFGTSSSSLWSAAAWDSNRSSRLENPNTTLNTYAGVHMVVGSDAEGFVGTQRTAAGTGRIVFATRASGTRAERGYLDHNGLAISVASSTAWGSAWDVSRTAQLINTDTTLNAYAGVQFVVGGNGEGFMGCTRTADGIGVLVFGARDGGVRSERAQLDAAALRPGTDNGQDLGSSAKRWKVVYAGTGTINTSDGREKTQIDALSPAEIDAARDLAAEIGTFRFLEAIAEKDDGARVHVGMAVQRAIQIMEQNGLDPFRYGFICYDSWPERVTNVPAITEERDTGLVDASGDPIVHTVEIAPARTDVTPAGDRYGFRESELLLFIARGFDARLRALEQ